MTAKKQPQEYKVVKTGVEFPHVRKKETVVVSEKEVRMLASLHCPATEMARYFGIKHDAFWNYFRDVIDSEKEKTKQKLRSKQLEEAMNGNVPLLIWLGKNLLGQTDSGPKEEDNRQPLPWNEEDF